MTVAELRSRLFDAWIDENRPDGFPRYVEQKYGIKLHFDGIRNPGDISDYTIVDEQKYLIFLLRRA